MLWRGCVLVISDGLADPLYDGELAGIIAHELGHSYFEDEMAAAQARQRRPRDASGRAEMRRGRHNVAEIAELRSGSLPERIAENPGHHQKKKSVERNLSVPS